MRAGSGEPEAVGGSLCAARAESGSLDAGDGAGEGGPAALRFLLAVGGALEEESTERDRFEAPFFALECFLI